MKAIEGGLSEGDRASRITALVRQLGEAARALEELVAGEVDAVVDPANGSAYILRHAQAALRRSEARMRLLLEQVPAVVWTTDLDLRLTYIGGRALDGLNGRGEELTGRALADLAEEERGLVSVVAAHHRALEGQKASYEATLADRVYQGMVEPTYDEAKRISGCAGVGVDVTERKEVQAALMESEKLALTGRMATSLAHAINNPLQSVIGCLSLAQEDLRAGRDALQYVEVALQELERVADLIAQTRDLNRRPDEGGRKATDVNALLERVLALTERECREGDVEVVWKPGAGLPRPWLLTGRMQQVFLHIVLNAVSAMPGGGRLVVWTEGSSGPSGVGIHFADSGRGIPAQDLARLFEPFYLTRVAGLGLGLFVGQHIVKEHGGRIDVQSVEGQGTTFSVWLPA
jgi:PAS domain S-box-containing protein